jgi:uncharacterized protein
MVEVSSAQSPSAEALRTFIETVVTFDADAVLPLMSANPVFEFPFAGTDFPSQLVGERAIRAFLASGKRTFGQLTAHDLRLQTTVDPGEAFAEFRSTGRYLDDGTAYTNRYICLVSVKDGLVARYKEYFNPLELRPSESRHPDSTIS